MKPLPTRVLITIHRPGLWLMGIVIFIVAICALLWSVYIYGQRAAGFDRPQAMNTISSLHEQIENLKKQSAENQHQAAMIERTSQINGDANKQLKKLLNDSQQKVLDLKKRVAFYKSVVDPHGQKRHLEIQSIQLLKGKEAGVYQYKIMLTQRGRNDRLVRGRIKISLEGSLAGKPRFLDITANRKNKSRFNFKYFHDFEGTVNLPARFTPENLQIMVIPSSYGVDKLDEEYSWADLSSGGN